MMDPAPPNLSFELQRAIGEIGERTRLVGHESVAIELTQPSARMALTNFNAMDGRIIKWVVPVAISTDTFVFRQKVPLPARCTRPDDY
jgi:hypothetical protein